MVALKICFHAVFNVNLFDYRKKTVTLHYFDDGFFLFLCIPEKVTSYWQSSYKFLDLRCSQNIPSKLRISLSSTAFVTPNKWDVFVERVLGLALIEVLAIYNIVLFAGKPRQIYRMLHCWAELGGSCHRSCLQRPSCGLRIHVCHVLHSRLRSGIHR